MKRKFITLIVLLLSIVSIACPLCKSNQPKGFENITHGQGPDGDFDYIIIYSAILIVGFTLIMSIKYLVKPKEKDKNHIKNIVLDEFN